MDGRKFFDSEAYFRGLSLSNRLSVDKGFTFCTCTGIEGIEGPLSLMRKTAAFFCLDDMNDGAMVRGRNGGWFKNRTFTVFLLHRYKVNDDADRAEKLGLCRELFRQIVAKMIVDEKDLSKDMIMLQPENIMSRELGHQFLPDVTGLYFMVDVAEPVDLQYRSEEWLA